VDVRAKFLSNEFSVKDTRAFSEAVAPLGFRGAAAADSSYVALLPARGYENAGFSESLSRPEDARVLRVLAEHVAAGSVAVVMQVATGTGTYVSCCAVTQGHVEALDLLDGLTGLMHE
jgi:hypothetical protein